MTKFEATLPTLESYLSGGIHRDREDIAAVERILAETGKTIDRNFDSAAKDWPYEIRREPSGEVRRFSQSTTAMMIHAIDRLVETVPDEVRQPYPFKVGDLSHELKKKRTSARAALIKDIRATSGTTTRGRDAFTSSGTYGLNDPLTLSFLAEILPESARGGERSVRANTRGELEHLTTLDPAHADKFFDWAAPATAQKLSTSTPLTNAFIPLRVIRACRRMGIDISKAQTTYLRYFESTLHDQLSYSSIPDSRFDPAELIFCLEGVLLLSEQSVDTRLFERVLDVLGSAQNTSAHWRPSKPFLRSERGLVLFPVSVEAANSLQRSCAKLDDNERFHPYSERYIALFRRFWEWLAARRVTLGPGKSGWHSDHVADPETIQLWDTAQVVSFLLGYRRSLYNHIARTTLRLSRFDVRKPKKPEGAWNDALRSAGDERVTIVGKYEPVTSIGRDYEVYTDIGSAFLKGWENGTPNNFSMLLYGPPGTGKTTVARNLADALGFDMITITVSDFLAGGGGEVEARAKMIFDVLEAQANVVILFDEIDELVLDRSSERHEKQDTVFRFMTPGMLTKLNNLRSAERSLFVMATNYAYRIDPAIRRTGRIDQNYLLLPPDAASRKRMISDFLDKVKTPHPLTPGGLTTGQWDELERASFFLGFSDIKAIIDRMTRWDATDQTVENLKGALLNCPRTTTLSIYKGAFAKSDEIEGIEREFLPLVCMTLEEGGDAAGANKALSVDSVAPDLRDSRGNAVYENIEDLKGRARKLKSGANGITE